MTIVAIMQPTFLPWAGYFDLIDQADCFVFLDNVEFSHRSWQHRNRIRTREGLSWLTAPVEWSRARRTSIAEARLCDLKPVHKARLTIAHSYAKARCAARELPWIDAYLASLREGASLAETNIAFIQAACERLRIRTPCIRASTLFGAAADRTQRLITLCRAIGGTSYLSPLGALSYLREEGAAFEAAGLPLRFHHYAHPEWRQTQAPFLPYASVLDLFLNEGDKALSILREGRRPSFSAAEAFALPPPAKPSEEAPLEALAS